jgi:RNA polymerase sigma-70 factor, ECF subfamily
MGTAVIRRGPGRPADSEATPPSVPEAVERELMSRAIAGDSEAYGELFEMHRDRISRMAYAIVHDRSSAEDVVQETFLKGLDRIATYRGEAAPRAWFSSIALNVCRHRLREGKREAERAGDRQLDGGRRLWRPRTKGAVSKAVQQENNRLLAIAMGYLTDAQREVFVLHYDQELAYEEIAQIVGIRPGAARALAHRAKAALRDKLGSEVWISRHATS